MRFLILGCGYTASRVARKLIEQGHTVGATTRHPERLEQLARSGVTIHSWDALQAGAIEQLRGIVEPGIRVLHSVPSILSGGSASDPTAEIVEALADRPARVGYLSTTGVYGPLHEVDESTEPRPVTERQRLRRDAELAVLSGPWQPLVLRPAAIYGPGRGVHRRIAEGSFRLLENGENFISRIHVDDLAEIAYRGLLSEVTGAYPVADDEPCRSREICEFCAELLGLPVPPPALEAELSETRRSDRRVDGRAIRRLLGVELQYPSFRSGVPAAIEAERREGLPGGRVGE
jgi:nucleoside-diphosphate-sugar epimerase